MEVYQRRSQQIAQKDKQGDIGVFSISRIAEKYVTEFMNQST